MQKGKGKRQEQDEYELLDRLERLESLREDMDELGVKSLDDLNLQIEALHHQIDEMKESL